MAGICLALGALALNLPTPEFTLAWTHSIEHTRWEEDYRIAADKLMLGEARVKGTGAGMEPGPGAVLENGWWRYRPPIPPQAELRLTRSWYAADYELCFAGACRPLSVWLGPPENGVVIEIRPCSAN